MVRLLFTLVFAFLTVALGCGRGTQNAASAGKYVCQGNLYLELKHDGTFYWAGTQEGNLVGKYEIEGEQITLTRNDGKMGRGKINDKVITFRYGDVVEHYTKR